MVTSVKPTPRAVERPGRLQSPPRVSGGLPLLGHTLDFVRDTVGLLNRAYRECGEVAEFRLLNKRMVLLTGPEASEAYFRAPDEQLSQKEAYKMMIPVFGRDVIFDASPARMKEQKGMLMPALRFNRFQAYADVIAEEVRRAISTWGDAGELNLLEFTKVLTNFTSSACILGREFREEMTEEFAHVYHDLEAGVTPIAYLSPNLPIPAFRKRDAARKRLQQMITAIVKKRQASGVEGDDLLQTLMESRYQNGDALSSHEITGMCLAAMFAGHHTSSVTVTWTLLELLQHPDYFARLRAQLDEVYAGTPRDQVDFTSLRQIPLTEHAVKEAIRIHPPLFMLLRKALKDFHYGGYRIPAGSFVIASPQVSNHVHSVFRNPHRFDPERFAPPREEDAVPFSYLSFGGGRHKCLGQHFALFQIKIIFSILLRNYAFELTDDPIEPDFTGLVVAPKQPCRVRYRRIPS